MCRSPRLLLVLIAVGITACESASAPATSTVTTEDSIARELAKCTGALERGEFASASAAFDSAAEAATRAAASHDDALGMHEADFDAALCMRMSIACEERRDWKRAEVARMCRANEPFLCSWTVLAINESDALQRVRCRLLSGEAEEALTDMWCVANPDVAEAFGKDPSLGLCPGDETAVIAYGLAGILSGHFAEVANRIHGLPEKERLAVLVDHIEDANAAFEAKHVNHFLEVSIPQLDGVRPLGWPDTSRFIEGRMIAHLLDRLGHASRDVLVERIDRGDLDALAIASWTHFFDLIPYIEAIPSSPNEPWRDQARNFAAEVLRFRQRFAK
jgi:hypothetical protein